MINTLKQSFVEKKKKKMKLERKNNEKTFFMFVFYYCVFNMRTLKFKTANVAIFVTDNHSYENNQQNLKKKKKGD